MAKAKANKLASVIKSASTPSDMPSAGPYKQSAKQIAEDRRWKAEDDLRTLQRAKEIQGDRSRMGMCKTVAKEQMKALSGVVGKSKRR